MSFDEGLAVGLALGKKRFGGGGGGDKWTYPADWIQMPSPASNEVYCVGTISLSEDKQVYLSMQNWGGETGTCFIDWGDGATTDLGLYSSALHTYTDGTGHLTDSGMEQFLIKVTMSNPADWGRVRLGANYGYNFALAFAYGADTLLPQTFDDMRTIHQVQLPNVTTLVGDFFGACQVLKKIITPTKLITIGGGWLNGCYSLEHIDLSEVTAIVGQGFGSNYRLTKLDMPKLTSVGDYGIRNCTALREINAPLLASVGNYALSNNLSLSKIIHAEGCTFGTHATQNCYNLYPNPAP